MTTFIKQQIIKVIDENLVMESASEIGQGIGYGKDWKPDTLLEALELLDQIAKGPTNKHGYTISTDEEIVEQDNRTIDFELYDHSANESIKGKIDAKGGLGIAIHFEGYGDHCSQDNAGHPIYIEKHDELSVHIYGDINSETPTHSIPLTGAQLDKRISE